MRVALRTRGGPSQGWGNVYRLAAVATALRARGHEIVCFLAEGPPEVAQMLRQRGFPAQELPDGLTAGAEADILTRAPKADLCVVEMLEIKPERQRLLRSVWPRLVVFDDLADQRYDADLVVCGQDLPGYGNQGLSAPGCRFLTGYGYFMPPAAIAAGAATPPRPSATPHRLLVTLGGGDYALAYVKIALAIRALPHPLAVTFLLGPAASAETMAEIAAILPNAVIRAGTDAMDSLYASHDSAVVSAGYSKLEAAIMGVPAISVATQWHQIPLGETFANRTGLPFVGYAGFLTPESLAATLADLLCSPDRNRLVAMGRRVVDGQGMTRVIAAIEVLAGEARP
ncbi:MAG: hypothetical protein AB7G62_08415 [Magnetospirillum sp.]